jgi:transcriptional regulator with XRE-family HTH domain
MADFRLLGNQPPVTTPATQLQTDFFVKLQIHAPMIAKLCAHSKQHIAHARRKNLLMAEKSVVELVAEEIRRRMAAHKPPLTETALGKKAGVSPRTVGNFLRPELRVSGANGKPPSGKLTELEMIARALGVEVGELISRQKTAPDQSPRAATAPWPFKQIRQTDVAALTPAQLDRLERSMLQRISELLEDAGQAGRFGNNLAA